MLRGRPQGIWGMTHADVNKGGHTNDFKVVRMESVKEHEIGLPVFAGKYIGYFKLTTGFQTETWVGFLSFLFFWFRVCVSWLCSCELNG